MEDHSEPETPSSSRYFLAPHVHACRTGRDIVLLDVKHDCYIGVDSRDNAELCQSVAGLSFAGAHGQTVIPAQVPIQGSLLQELLMRGLISERETPRLLPETSSLKRPDCVLVDGYARRRSALTALDVAAGVLAMTKAALLLRWLSFAQNIERVHRAHARHSHRAFDMEEARRSVIKFNKIRPLMYADHDACLFSSLAMHEFLARRGLHPRVVLGVATRPFSAHCWLQHETVVINDRLERVNEYIPILCV